MIFDPVRPGGGGFGGRQEEPKALRIGRRVAGPGQVTLFETLGMFRLLSLIEDTDELRTFATDTLGGVLALMPDVRSELMRRPAGRSRVGLSTWRHRLHRGRRP